MLGGGAEKVGGGRGVTPRDRLIRLRSGPTYAPHRHIGENQGTDAAMHTKARSKHIVVGTIKYTGSTADSGMPLDLDQRAMSMGCGMLDHVQCLITCHGLTI